MCSGCVKLKKIPNYGKSLRILICNGCLRVQEIPHIKNLEILMCSGTKIKTVPKFEKLNQLTIDFCKNLEIVPEIKTLKILSCENCTRIKKYSSSRKISQNKY